MTISSAKDKELRALAEAMIERMKRRADMTPAEEIAFDFGLDDLAESWEDAANPQTVLGLLDRIAGLEEENLKLKEAFIARGL